MALLECQGFFCRSAFHDLLTGGAERFKALGEQLGSLTAREITEIPARVTGVTTCAAAKEWPSMVR
jgi:hypothetical protein